jgi:PAS domain S-box-containing protein
MPQPTAEEPDPNEVPTEQRFAWPLILIVTGLVFVISVLGFLSLHRQRFAAQTSVKNDLKAIANLKVEEIANWRNERLDDGRFLAHAPFASEDVAALLAKPDSVEIRHRVSRWLALMRAGDRYETALLFDAAGNLQLAEPQSRQAQAAAVRDFLPTALGSKDAALTDLHRDEGNGPIHIELLVPIFSPDARQGAPIAAVVLRMNPGQFLFPLLQRWPKTSSTAETVLVRVEGDEVVYLNELRHQHGTALTLRRPVSDPHLPAAMAARGPPGVFDGVDYRGASVLAAILPIPYSPWILIAKVDSSEAYLPIDDEMWRTGLSVAVLLAAFVLAGAYLWRQIHEAFIGREEALGRERRTLAERLAAITQHANDIILFLDQNGRILEANDRALATYGYNLEELRQLPPGGLRPPEAMNRLALQFGSIASPDGTVFETVHRRRDGSTFPVEVSGRAVEIEGRKYSLGIYRDLTQRNAHEREIERLNQLYLVLSQINQTIVRVETREALFSGVCKALIEYGRFKLAWIGWANPKTSAVDVVGQAGETDFLRGIQVFTDNRPEGCGPTGTCIRESRTYVCNDFAGDPRVGPWRAEGARHGIAASVALPIREGGVVQGALSAYSADKNAFGEKEIALLEEAVFDISFALDHLENERQRKEVETALRREQTLFTNLVGAIPDHMYFKDTQSRFVRINDSMARAFGLRDPSEAIGLTDRDFFTEEHAARALADEQRIMRFGLPIIGLEEMETWPDGRRTWVSTTKVALRDTNGTITGLVGISRDITEHKLANEKIREQAALLDQANDAIYVLGMDATIRYWNEGAVRLYGWSAAEAVGCKLAELNLGDNDQQENIDASLRRTGGWAGERRQTARDGTKLTVFSRLTLTQEARGQPAAIIAISTDVTEKKQIEAQFLQAQRLENLGSLASGLAHDLNNVLGPVLMATAFLKERLPDEADQNMIAAMEASAKRGAGIVRQVLTFARGVKGERVPVNLSNLLRETVDIVTETFPPTIEVKFAAPKDLWPVIGDATQLHQILMNLCINARDAMPRGGALSLTAENMSIDEAFSAMVPGARPGPHVCVKVADTGTGISQEHRKRIFEPFFTTKEKGKGTGLGLSTVMGITKSHGGFLRVKSAPGQGTCFEIYLPATPSAELLPEWTVQKGPARGEGQTILVVDDELAIRLVAGRILDNAGYKAMCAADGSEAIAIYAKHGERIAGVVTDMVMPGMDGPTLARTLRQINPSLPILGITGLGEHDGAETFEALGLPALLIKPFTSEKLLRALSDALQAVPGVR